MKKKKDSTPRNYEEYEQRIVTYDDLPKQYRPLGAWKYFWLTILYSIPVAGFIFLVLHSISDANINRRSFARSHWIPAILVFVIFLLTCLINVLSGSILTTDTFVKLLENFANFIKG